MLYSVIIPHKNCPALLERCVNSIPKRDDIQVIIVDDNSADIKPLTDLEEKCKDRNAVFLYTKEGKGAGFARNKGLEAAKGKWLLFADSDDFFDENAFQEFDCFSGTEFDMVYFRHRSVFSDSLASCERYDVRNDMILQYLQFKSRDVELNIRYKDVVPWAKMIRTQLVDSHRIRFDEVPASNDVMFVLQSARFSESTAISDTIVYVTTFREGSITRVVNKENNFSRFKICLKYNNVVKEDGLPDMRNRVFSYVLLAFRSFGCKEAFRYIKEAHFNGQCLFTGGIPGISRIIERILPHKNIFKG